MKLYHTSSDAITEINRHGRFGEFLFFAAQPYKMSAGETLTYSIEIAAACCVTAGHLFHEEEAHKLSGLVKEFSARFGVDEDTAEEIISERQQLPFDEDRADEYAEDLWDVQKYTARAAKLLGYRGVLVQDEQGTSVMIDMMGYEKELQLLETIDD